MEKQMSFVSIDFEWVSDEKDACAVGMVKVLNGVVSGKFYSLINPETDNWNPHCCDRHGITPEMVKDAPTFAQLEPLMEFFAGDLLHVGHNYAQAERHVFDGHAREGSPLKGVEFVDTMKDDKRKLTERCAELGIPLEEHHDALEDAMATALLYMKLQDAEIIKPTPSEKPKEKAVRTKRDSSLNVSAELDSVGYKDNPFYGKIFVVSGFSPASKRDALINLLRDKLGGTNRNGVNSKTGILISHTSQDGSEFSEKGSKRKDAIANNVPYHNEIWLYEEVICKYGLQKEWDEIFS